MRILRMMQGPRIDREATNLWQRKGFKVPGHDATWRLLIIQYAHLNIFTQCLRFCANRIVVRKLSPWTWHVLQASSSWGIYIWSKMNSILEISSTCDQIQRIEKELSHCTSFAFAFVLSNYSRCVDRICMHFKYISIVLLHRIMQFRLYHTKFAAFQTV